MKYLVCFLLFFGGLSTAQTKEYNSEVISVTPLIDGTLLIPDAKDPPLAIIIAGSGPTDRNGNQPMMRNNSLKFLAEGLYANDIATFSYDKRIVKLLKRGSVDERKIRFDDFISDAIAVVEHFKKDNRFSGIFIIGHSQGSLIGMIAAQEGVDGFISVGGAGQEIDDVIVDQLTQQAPGLTASARVAFDDLRVNGIANNFNPGLASIFRQEIQPFMFTWMKYNPQKEIQKLSIPVFIINGDKDLQVQVSEAALLKAARPEAEYLIIKNMNHIFKEVEGNSLENSKTYNQYNLPVMPELIDAISDFIKK